MKLHRRSVHHDFGDGLHDGCGGKAHADDGISTHSVSLGDHPICGYGSCVIHHFIVLLQLAADQGFQPRADVADGIHGLNRGAFDQSKGGMRVLPEMVSS